MNGFTAFVQKGHRFVTAKDPAYEAERNKCMAGDEKLESKSQCQLLMGMQADVYARREAAGKAIQYDVPLEGWQENPAHQIKEVGRAIGICEAAIDNKHLLAFLHRMGLYLGSKQGYVGNQYGSVHNECARGP